MKFARYAVDGKVGLGRVDDAIQTIQPVALKEAVKGDDGVVALISNTYLEDGNVLPVSDVTLLAPIPQPRRNIFCVGKNYFEHAQEFSASGFDSSAAAGAIPQNPIIFSKLPQSVIDPNAAIIIDANISTMIDYEAELAVIIGKSGKNISKQAALDHVWGYTIINDVTARDLQGKHSQWLIGKSQDTFCPMGPVVTTKEDFDLACAKVQCRVNGELRQNSHTGLLIFDVPTIIAAISNGITLNVGDVIATGTPAGVGIGFKPPKYLQPGDHVAIEIDGIGRLENPVVEI